MPILVVAFNAQPFLQLTSDLPFIHVDLTHSQYHYFLPDPANPPYSKAMLHYSAPSVFLSSKNTNPLLHKKKRKNLSNVFLPFYTPKNVALIRLLKYKLSTTLRAVNGIRFYNSFCFTRLCP